MPLPAPSPASTRRSKRDSSPLPLPTREVILDTAERLFALRGVDGVAVRDLAREMNLTAPSLYNHFPSKQALYDAVLERGLQPIVQFISEAWHPGSLRLENVHQTVDRMLAHLVGHPHLARLLQRALLEQSGSAHELLSRWMSPLYREGFAVIRESAGVAGWEREELPHLALGLFGMVFAYFTNIAALATISPEVDPFSPRALATQRRFLEKAIYRLLGPQLGEQRRKHS
ncbi:MAG: TetR/AcrR family transcriptional regulator [Deltaproteobacteria bacterium]|nr:TetR/AcrR family transcriptional regulator [Deltaproteobacteria bacterium]